MPQQVTLIAANIVKIEFIGDVTDDDALQNADQIDQFIANLPADERLHFLVDATRIGKISTRARHVFTERNKNPRVGHTAIFGVNRALKVLGVFIAKASKRDNLHFVNDEAEGLAWLQEKANHKW
jgi:hypothetical protein